TTNSHEAPNSQKQNESDTAWFHADRNKHRNGRDDGCRSRLLFALCVLDTEQRRRRRQSPRDGSGPAAVGTNKSRQLRRCKPELRYNYFNCEKWRAKL